MTEEFNTDLPERWPRPGDQLFVETSRAFSAQVATFQGEHLYRMKKAFKTSGDVFVSQTEDDPHERSNLIWPIVFSYRQYLELALKDMIATHGSQVIPEIKPHWVDHALGPLWASYKKLIAATLIEGKVDQITEIAAVEACIG